MHLGWETLSHHAHFKDVKGEAQRGYVICLTSNLDGAESPGSQLYPTPKLKPFSPGSMAFLLLLSRSFVKFTNTIPKRFQFCGSHPTRIIAQVSDCFMLPGKKNLGKGLGDRGFLWEMISENRRERAGSTRHRGRESQCKVGLSLVLQ